MKRTLTAVLLVLMLLVAMTGCSAVHAVEKLDAAEDRIEEKLDTVQEKLENRIQNAVRPETHSGSGEAAGNLTGEQALKIALDYLGFSADQVTRLRTEYEIDDGISQYDVSFHQGDWEYEFEIQAETGKILSYDKDHKYD